MLLITANNVSMTKIQYETIVLGGGCFGCLHATYKLIKGIVKVEEGYSGGKVGITYYDQIDINITGQAEVVKITYDPNIIKLKDILSIFGQSMTQRLSISRVMTRAHNTASYFLFKRQPESHY